MIHIAIICWGYLNLHRRPLLLKLLPSDTSCHHAPGPALRGMKPRVLPQAPWAVAGSPGVSRGELPSHLQPVGTPEKPRTPFSLFIASAPSLWNVAGARTTRLWFSEGPPVGQMKPKVFSLTICPNLEWIFQVDRSSTLLTMRGLSAKIQAFTRKLELFNWFSGNLPK